MEEVDDDDQDLPSWKADSDEPMRVGRHLNETQLATGTSKTLGHLRCNLPISSGVYHTGQAPHPPLTNNPDSTNPYRIPYAFRDEVNRELDEMLHHSIIERSTSDWASPMVVIQKKDKSLRLCVDYRKLNALSQGDAYTMPRVDDHRPGGKHPLHHLH